MCTESADSTDSFSRLNIQNRVVKFQVLKAGSYFQIYEFKDGADKECQQERQGRRTQSAGGRAVRQAASSFSKVKEKSSKDPSADQAKTQR